MDLNSKTDVENKRFQQAAGFVEHTGRHLFLTGKAGTGKTTFLHHIRKHTAKNAIVVAPTGVAAINARGVTMHSFFQLPFTPFIPEAAPQQLIFGDQSAHSKQTLFKKLRFNKNKRKLIRELELLIIDEVSMLRADMLDAIDAILRHFRHKPAVPFGGVQVLFIGDLYQLPPVVLNNEWQILKNYYPSPFFFDAHVLREAPPVYIELEKIYRQSDSEFITLLNKIRHNTLEPEELEELNQYYQPDFKPPREEQYITLCSHNYKAKNINESELMRLPGQAEKFRAEVEGNFNENAYPAEETLELKEGAQVMFIRNDKGEEKRFYNGKIGKIEKIANRIIEVRFPGENDSILLEKEEWHNIRYQYNSAQKKLEEEVVGTFRQYPIRLAWAVTIHKSQGLTFDKAVIDAGGSFTAGQVYVALSRLSNIKKLVLKSVIRPQSIQCDPRVLNFTDHFKYDDREMNALLAEESNAYILRLINKSFDWENICNAFESFIENIEARKIPKKEEAIASAEKMYLTIQKQKKPADTFRLQLNQITQESPPDYAKLYERLKAAEGYFIPQLQKIIIALKQQIEEYKKERRVKKYLEALHEVLVECESKISEIKESTELAKGLQSGKEEESLLQQLHSNKQNRSFSEAPKVTKTKAKKGESRKLSLEYFKSGMDVAQIAEERNLAPGTIESHLIYFVQTGEIDIYKLIDSKKVDEILKAFDKGSDRSLSEIKSELPENYTYNEIRAVGNHLQHEMNKSQF